jgi:hypothetical protein
MGVETADAVATDAASGAAAEVGCLGRGLLLSDYTVYGGTAYSPISPTERQR